MKFKLNETKSRLDKDFYDRLELDLTKADKPDAVYLTLAGLFCAALRDFFNYRNNGLMSKAIKYCTDFDLDIDETYIFYALLNDYYGNYITDFNGYEINAHPDMTVNDSNLVARILLKVAELEDVEEAYKCILAYCLHNLHKVTASIKTPTELKKSWKSSRDFSMF